MSCYDYPYCTCACRDCIDAELNDWGDNWHCAVHGRGCHKGCGEEH